VPLRTWVRSGLDWPNGSPQTASASADIKVLMNVVNIERSGSPHCPSPPVDLPA
jgi:hypothetical protein